MTLKHMTEDTFKADTKEGVVLVDFYADWCGPCRMMTPILEKLAGEVKGKATVAKINVDTAQGVTSQFNVTSIPTLVLMKNGHEVGRLVGLQDADAIRSFITTT